MYVKGCKLWETTSVLTDSITQWCRPLNRQFVHLFLALWYLIIHTPPLFLSANHPHPPSYFSFLFWFGSHLSHLILSLRFLFAISQSMRLKWEIICNITLQCASLMKRGACAGTMWVGYVCVQGVSCSLHAFFPLTASVCHQYLVLHTTWLLFSERSTATCLRITDWLHP